MHVSHAISYACDLVGLSYSLVYLLGDGVYLSFFDQLLLAFNRGTSMAQIKLLSKHFITVLGILVDTAQSPY